MAVAFGEYLLDVGRRELRRGSEPVKLEPQVFDLLAYLVRHRDRALSKDDLLQAIWAGRIVSETALTTRINAVRRALGESGKAQRFIRTLPRHGYRFVAEVAEAAPPREMPVGAGARPTHLAPPQRPAIAVLPFADTAHDPEMQSFADGLGEEIAMALSRVHWLAVVCVDPRVVRRGLSPDLKRIGQELGLRYILQGAVRKDRDRLRITVRLVEAASGLYLWADHFAGLLADGFELQDKVAALVTGAAEPALQAAEQRRSSLMPEDSLTARDLRMLAHPIFSDGKHAVLRSLQYIEQALALDRDYGPALADAAFCHQILDINGWTADREANCRKAIDFARRALRASDDAEPLATAAHVLAYFGENIDTARELVNHALALNPNFARGWFMSGMIRLYAGNPDQAVEHFERSLRLNPRDRIGRRNVAGIGIAHLFGGKFDEAIPRLRLAVEEFPRWATPCGALAASYAQSGFLGEAEATAQWLKRSDPLLVPSASQFRIEAHRKMLVQGLRLAGRVIASSRIIAASLCVMLLAGMLALAACSHSANVGSVRWARNLRTQSRGVGRPIGAACVAYSLRGVYLIA